jgi:hypothetical protein
MSLLEMEWFDFAQTIWSKAKIDFAHLSHPIGFFTKLYSCFYKINLVNVQIFIRAGERKF